jgi:hypothetical protein
MSNVKVQRTNETKNNVKGKVQNFGIWILTFEFYMAFGL